MLSALVIMLVVLCVINLCAFVMLSGSVSILDSQLEAVFQVLDRHHNHREETRIEVRPELREIYLKRNT